LHHVVSEELTGWSSYSWRRQLSSSETFVSIYRTTHCNNPEDGHLHIHHQENLKYNFALLFPFYLLLMWKMWVYMWG
jgi:hypothetical protein